MAGCETRPAGVKAYPGAYFQVPPGDRVLERIQSFAFQCRVFGSEAFGFPIPDRGDLGFDGRRRC